MLCYFIRYTIFKYVFLSKQFMMNGKIASESTYRPTAKFMDNS